MDINQIMKKAQDLQSKMQKAQQELETVEVSGSAGGGGFSVKITLNGKGIVKRCEIDQSLMDDKSMLEDLITAACNNAKNRMDETVSDKMKSIGISPDMLNM
jgi:DNA-binding YbaB/EbfC family protein